MALRTPLSRQECPCSCHRQMWRMTTNQNPETTSSAICGKVGQTVPANTPSYTIHVDVHYIWCIRNNRRKMEYTQQWRGNNCFNQETAWNVADTALLLVTELMAGVMYWVSQCVYTGASLLCCSFMSHWITITLNQGFRQRQAFFCLKPCLPAQGWGSQRGRFSLHVSRKCQHWWCTWVVFVTQATFWKYCMVHEGVMHWIWRTVGEIDW